MHRSICSKLFASIGQRQYPNIISKVRSISSTATRHGAAETKIDNQSVVEDEVKNPLLKLKSIAETFDLCDKNGFRKVDRHWTFALSIVDSSSSSGQNMVYASEDNNNESTTKKFLNKAPILRTVHLQRVSEKGMDFVMKNKGYSSDLLFRSDQGVSFLHTIGQYLPGQKIQQWRSWGICEPIRLTEIIEYVPTFTIVEMVASLRANKEGDSRSDMELSHFTEIVQQTREELDNGSVPMMELEEAVRAWRFVPYQVEQMIGGPEQIMWERNEWLRQKGDDKEYNWIKPVRLMPF